MVPAPRPSPRLARLLCPHGTARDRLVTAGDDRVYAVAGRYGVTYLVVSADRVAVVDCGSHDDVALVLDALEGLGYGPAQVAFVLPTHLHFDHIMGLDALARALDVPVALGPVAWDHVHRGRRLRFFDPLRALRALPTWPMQGLPFFTAADWRDGLGFGFPWSRNRFRARLMPLDGPAAPLPGFEGWTVLHTPGHSDDALCLHHAGHGWLITGDTLRNFLGGEWNPLQCDPPAYARTRRALEALQVRWVFPGHGPVFHTPGGLRGVRDRPWWQP